MSASSQALVVLAALHPAPSGAASFSPLPAVVGRPAAPAASPTEDSVCRSPAPMIVIDNFSGEGRIAPYMDVDGDEVPDVGHGEVVAAILKAGGKGSVPLDLGGDGSIGHVAELLDKAAAGIESGAWEASAVNLSQVVEVSFGALNAELTLPKPVDAGNILARREALAAAVAAMMEANDSPDFGRLLRAAGRLEVLGVPILVAAGNQGPGKVNLVGLIPGAVSVGALARDGSKLPSSADNTMVGFWRLGEHVMKKVTDGVDLDGDGLGDFDARRLSGGLPAASRWVGKLPSEALRETPKDHDLDIISRETEGGLSYLRSRLPDGLYRVDDLAAFFRLSPAQARRFALRGPYMDKTFRYSYREDVSGRLVFDPEGSGAPGQAVVLSGTSFAAPALCWRR